MRTEERSQPLTDGSILEYIVHGEFAWKETDVNSTYGAWWMSLRTIVREVGARRRWRRSWRSSTKESID